jgi:hypothetical protein
MIHNHKMLAWWYDPKYGEIAIQLRLYRCWGFQLKGTLGDFNGWDRPFAVGFELSLWGLVIQFGLGSISIFWNF